MKRFIFYFLASLLLIPCTSLWAQAPSVEILGTYYRTDDLGEEETGDVNGQTLSAPFRVEFTATPTIPEEGYNSYVWYEWTLWNVNEPDKILLRRNEESFEYEFVETGSFVVQLCAYFYDEKGVSDENIRYRIAKGEDSDEAPKTISFTVSESYLDFPNAISPGCSEGQNDKLIPKDGYKGIVSFHAAIFNRWGKKLYSWDDIHDGWDGKYNGKYVKDGVYFLNVSAKGSDGIDYKIRKAINVITGYNTDSENGNGSGEGGYE